jgi:CRISPR-associated protein Cas1
MAWRSVVISNPAQLRLENRALVVAQEAGTARVMLEDISALILETPQATITSAVLSACMAAQVCVVTVDERHMPNGVLTPYQCHSRSLKVLRAQLDLGQPARKRIWQRIVQAKVANQAAVLVHFGREDEGHKLQVLVGRVGSGDPGNIEARAAQSYFKALYGKEFTRGQGRLINAALDYGYAILRATLARDLVAHGFVTALGLFHRSELNAFNLADDLLEPFRPVVDRKVMEVFGSETDRELVSADKAALVGVLHDNVALTQGDEHTGARTVLAAMQATVASLSAIVLNAGVPSELLLPDLTCKVVVAAGDDEFE